MWHESTILDRNGENRRNKNGVMEETAAAEINGDVEQVQLDMAGQRSRNSL